MNSRQFDDLIRGIFTPIASRRAALRLLVGGALGAALNGVGAGNMAAACAKIGRPCDRDGQCCAGSRCKHGKCRCRAGWRDCTGNGRCQNLQTTPAHCGDCATSCPAPNHGVATCAGRCAFTCDAGYVPCQSSCCVTTCSASTPFAYCNNQANGCFCLTSTEGTVFCGDGHSSCSLYPTCSSTAGCPVGSSCVPNTNCGDSRCFPACPPA